MGPWTNQGLFAPRGSNTYNSQTFKGLAISGPKGQVFIYIGHQYLPHGGPPFCECGLLLLRDDTCFRLHRLRLLTHFCAANASNIWLPVEFTEDNLVQTPLKYRDSWNLNLDGAWTPALRD
eukprot:COSAG04_NODE_1128_length_8137_cov_4.719831_6_plen_121_part_00